MNPTSQKFYANQIYNRKTIYSTMIYVKGL